MRALNSFAIVAVAIFCALPAQTSAAPNSKERAAHSINDYELDRIITSIQCLPHDLDVESKSNAKDAIRDGEADMNAGHCVKAIADFQFAIDANPSDVNALWHQELAAYREAGLTSDVGLSVRLFETAYHDTDLAIAAQPKNPVYYLMRASTRIALLRAHAEHKNAFSRDKYVASENQHSYDDLTTAITISPTYGEAYSSRYLIDLYRHDQESANSDITQAEKYNPESAKQARNMYAGYRQQVEAYDAERARRSMAMANAMMGLAAAAGGGTVVPIYAPH